MREIRFRIWDTKENKWYKAINEAYNGTIYQLFIGICGEICARTMDRFEHKTSTEPGRYMLQQYTGLKDKNGQEIYFDDVVKNRRGDIMRVMRNEEQVCIGAETIHSEPGPKYNTSDYKSTRDVMNKWEVIGNIYENPELLE